MTIADHAPPEVRGRAIAAARLYGAVTIVGSQLLFLVPEHQTSSAEAAMRHLYPGGVSYTTDPVPSADTVARPPSVQREMGSELLKYLGVDLTHP